MGLTSIGNQLTPGDPSEITFAPPQGLPSGQQSILLIGHMASSAPTGTTAYSVIQMANVADIAAASGEASGYFGAGSELAKMVVAAVKANQLKGTFPPIKCSPLLFTDSDWGQSLTKINKVPAEYLVSPYDGNSQVLSQALLTQAASMSAASRVDNGQYGTLAVAANRSVVSPADLFKYDTAFGSFQWLRDTGTGDNAPELSLGEVAASVAAQLAANGVPYNPVKNVILPNIAAPKLQDDWISVGAGMESELCLSQGWSPLRVLPNGRVVHLRARTLRVTTGDGVTSVTSYFDVPDFNVLFLWKKTITTRFAQDDVTQVKASQGEADELLSEVIRLANLFEDEGMFQAVKQLAKLFKIQRNTSDRSRFDVFTPVNVIPILAVVASNIQATTVGDTLTV